jgi:hypothetical protein
MEFISGNADDVHKNAARTSCRPKRTPITRNEDFFYCKVHSFIHSFIMHSVNPYKVNQPIGYRTCHSVHIKNGVVGVSVRSGNFTTIPYTINQNINENYCLAKTSVNNQNKFSFSLKHVFQNSFPSIKYHCTSNKEIENIIMSFKSSNSCGYDEVPTKLLKLCSYFISSSLNYICNRTLFTGVFLDR